MSTSPKVTSTMPTNLGGRLRNTPLPLTSGLLPLFEAIVNSIHAIEEAGVSTMEGRIAITILRKAKQGSLDLSDSKKKGPDALEDIIGFRILDNGIGFTDVNTPTIGGMVYWANQHTALVAGIWWWIAAPVVLVASPSVAVVASSTFPARPASHSPAK